MSLIDALNWRYATKKYDTTKSISDEDYQTIMEAIRLTPTSYGLQLFKVLDIEDAEIKEKLVPASWGQTQATTASKYMVFCVPEKLTGELIDDIVKSKAESLGKSVEDYKGYVEFIKGKKLGQPDGDNRNWLSKQAYIALGIAMTAAADLRIDASPMEGFEADQYSEILGLKEKGLAPVVVLALGYRSEEDQTQFAPKTRRAMSDLVEVI